MLRKMMIALTATVALGVLAPGAVSARGFGGHGGGFGGFHGGFGGFHGGGFGGFHGGFGGFHRHAFIGGVGIPYGYYGGDYPYDDYSDYGYPAYYGGGYVVEGGCSVVRQRVHTRRGWRVRTIQICD